MSVDHDVPLEALRLPRLKPLGILLLIVLPLALIGLGIYGYIQQRVHGDVVTNMRSLGSGGASWGIYIMSYIFFVGLAIAGVAVATIAHLFKVRDLRQLSRIAEFLAVVALVQAVLCVMADQGRPMSALLNLPRYARVASPFFGSFTLIVGVDIAASLVMLYLGGRGDAAWCGRRSGPLKWMYKVWASGYQGNDRELHRHRKARFWLSLAVFPFVIIAYSTLGFIFGIQGGRPGWFGALRAPSMLVVASISGIGLLGSIGGILHLKLGAREAIPERLFARLGITLGVLLSAFFYIVLVETLTERYVGRKAELRVADSIVFGAYAPAFWAMIGTFGVSLAIVFVQFLRRKPMIGWMIVVGVLVNVGAVLRRFLVIVPAQTHGHNLNYPAGIYYPNLNEVMVLAGIASIGVLAFVVFMRFFPIVALHSYHGRIRGEPMPEGKGRSVLRMGLTSTAFFGGIGLASFGLAMSARVGTLPYLDPIVPLSPVIFIVGVVMTLYSAAVYVVAPPG